MTAPTTVEAMLFALRSGLSCLANPGNRDRLQACDPAAMREIAARLHSWRALRAAWLPAWDDGDVKRLILVWRALREGRS